MSLPFISFDPKKDWSIAPLQTYAPKDEAYWKMVRKQFPLKEGQTYFNNGTMGPTPGYVLDKMFDHMMHWNVEVVSKTMIPGGQ